MITCASNGMQLRYETFGDPGDEPVLLVMGLGASMEGWHEDWCDQLAAHGRFVIRFDNRDAGHSTKFDGVAVDLPAVMAAWAGQGEMPPVPYVLADMARDAWGVLDHLGIERAHLVGASLGGMIVQTMAIEAPERVRTLTSIMSTTGDAATYQSVPEVRAKLLVPRPADPEEALAQAVEMSRLIGSRRHFDPVARADRLRAVARIVQHYPEGMLRQTAAIRASGSRDEALRKVRVPTLVIHGRDDTLILPIAGEHTAEVIEGSRYLLVSDMGHDLPLPLWPVLIDAIASHTAHAII